MYLSVNACSFLTKCRPLSVSMGNAITHLKFRISSISPELPESEVLISLVIHFIEPSKGCRFLCRPRSHFCELSTTTSKRRSFWLTRQSLSPARRSSMMVTSFWCMHSTFAKHVNQCAYISAVIISLSTTYINFYYHTVLPLFKSVLWTRMTLGRIFESSWWTQDQKWKVGE